MRSCSPPAAHPSGLALSVHHPPVRLVRAGGTFAYTVPVRLPFLPGPSDDESFSLPLLPRGPRLAAVVLAFFALGLLVYGKSLGNGFVRWDDGLLITENPLIRAITPRTVAGMFSTFDPELYIPLTFLTYAFDFAVGGTQPFIYHFHSLVLHIFNALLLAWLLFLVFRRDWVALLGGAVFLLHPLNVEAVAWASARKDVLSTFWFLMTVLTYLYARDRGGRWLPIFSVACFLLACLSKVVVITLPLLLLLLDDLLGRPRSVRMLTDKLAYVALSVVFGLVAVLGKTGVLAQSTLAEKVLMAGKSAGFYLRMFLWPTGLSVVYPYIGEVSAAKPEFWIPPLILLILLACACLLRRRTRVAFFALAFYLVAVSPSFINFAKGDNDLYFASDRYAYLPMLGLVVGACGLFAWVAARIRRPMPVAAVGAVACLACAALTVRQSLTWADTKSLFLHAIDLYPESYVAHANLANAYRREGDDASAIAAFEKSVAIRAHPRTLSNLGAVQRKLGQLDAAQATYDRALAVDPRSPDAHFGLGLLREAQGHIDDALAEYRKTVEIEPLYEQAHSNIGTLLLKRGDTDGAVAAFRAAIAANQLFPDARYNLGVALTRAGDTEGAIASYAQAIGIDPTMVSARLNLGVLLYNSGDTEAARRQFLEVLRLDPGNAGATKALRQIGQ